MAAGALAGTAALVLQAKPGPDPRHADAMMLCAGSDPALDIKSQFSQSLRVRCFDHEYLPGLSLGAFAHRRAV